MKCENISRLVNLFFKGLERNFKIINYGDVPDIYINPAHMKKYRFASWSFFSYFFVALHLLKNLLAPFYKCYMPHTSDIFFCGATANNEREFLFFNNLLSSKIPDIAYSRNSNLSFVQNQKNLKNFSEWTMSIIIYLMSLIYLFRIKICPTSYKYLSVYSNLFFRLFSSFERCNFTPKLAVVANDHTDFPVVFSMVMKYFGVPIIYIQHAEVTKYFPILDFNISILRNQKSLEIYKEIGPLYGNVFIIPRSERNVNFSNIFSKTLVPVKIVIYLSSVYDLKMVKECVFALANNTDVDCITIKRHPRVSNVQLKLHFNIEILDVIPNYEHIAIVPNSSVAIELLQQGIKVFQYFKLDGVNEDYYGLVKDGVTPEVGLKDLRESFWNVDFYNDVWFTRFEKYAPEAVSNQMISVLEESVKHILSPNYSILI